jgi:nucleoside-diphosphate-sugar epimerase
MIPPAETDEFPRAIADGDLPRPQTVYGSTKAFGELLGRHYHDRYGIEFVGLRIGWFGPHDARQAGAFRQNPEALKIFLSPRDGANLFRCAVEREGVRFALAFGTSKTGEEFLSLRAAREVLGYEPQDDAASMGLA